MSDHYYSKQPVSKMITDTKTVNLKSHFLTFTMSTGVFAKKDIDFGSRTLIESFIVPKVEGDLLDLGCGYGPIGLTLAKEYPNRTVRMVDVNERAVHLSRVNAEENNITNVVVEQSDGFESLNHQVFAAIITNPPIRAGKRKMYDMMITSKEHLLRNGELWVVIQKKQGAPSMIKFLETLFHEVTIVERSKGYYIIQAIKHH